jgi:hypothetical protein
MIRVASSFAFALALTLGAGAVPAADTTVTTKHSGSVVAVDPQGGVLVMEEVGPWRVEQGTTVVTRRTIRLTSATRFNTFIRVDVPGRFAGDFIEVALDAEDITPGDFVTAECVRERGRLVAVQVTMAELR